MLDLSHQDENNPEDITDAMMNLMSSEEEEEEQDGSQAHHGEHPNDNYDEEHGTPQQG